MASGLIVPPGGFAGFSQMTVASRAALSRGGSSRGPSRSRRRKGRKTKARRPISAKRSTRRTKRGGGRRMKFGSPAWQRKYRVGKFAKKRR